MCTILLAWHATADADYVLAANRDELVQRPAAPPELLSTLPPIAGGRDLLAGGTWLAVAADGRLCAVTNRRPRDGSEVSRDPSRRSRGELPMLLLTDVAERELPAYLSRIDPRRYNPVNVLYVSPSLAVVASIDNDGPPRVSLLEPGAHILTVGDINDERRAKDVTLGGYFARVEQGAKTGERLEHMLRTVLSRHDTPTGDPLDRACIHGDEYGTVSSATVIVAGGVPTYRHAQGRPCVTPFVRVEALEQAA